MGQAGEHGIHGLVVVARDKDRLPAQAGVQAGAGGHLALARARRPLNDRERHGKKRGNGPALLRAQGGGVRDQPLVHGRLPGHFPRCFVEEEIFQGGLLKVLVRGFGHLLELADKAGGVACAASGKKNGLVVDAGHEGRRHGLVVWPCGIQGFADKGAQKAFEGFGEGRKVLARRPPVPVQTFNHWIWSWIWIVHGFLERRAKARGVEKALSEAGVCEVPAKPPPVQQGASGEQRKSGAVLLNAKAERVEKDGRHANCGSSPRIRFPGQVDGIAQHKVVTPRAPEALHVLDAPASVQEEGPGIVRCVRRIVRVPRPLAANIGEILAQAFLPGKTVHAGVRAQAGHVVDEKPAEKVPVVAPCPLRASPLYGGPFAERLAWVDFEPPLAFVYPSAHKQGADCPERPALGNPGFACHEPCQRQGPRRTAPKLLQDHELDGRIRVRCRPGLAVVPGEGGFHVCAPLGVIRACSWRVNQGFSQGNTLFMRPGPSASSKEGALGPGKSSRLQ